MAPRAHPQLSITLPKNFTFHYNEGEEPKTPENEISQPFEVPKAPSPPKAPSLHAYRVRRRTRASVLSSNLFGQSATIASVISSDVFDQPNAMTAAKDIPIPTIEIPSTSEYNPQPSIQEPHRALEGYLSPCLPRLVMPAPRTPSAQRPPFSSEWIGPSSKDIGDAITRPMSACSILSDSSDDSNASSEDCLSLGGSCTSPESDGGDPFGFTINKRQSKLQSLFAQETPISKPGKVAPSKAVKWTAEMDNHIWTTYCVYLQDPTVTPFKMIPGSSPPLGVCHRVTREAKRTWRNVRLFTAMSPKSVTPEIDSARDIAVRGGSPDTIKPERSGCTTPTAIPQKPLWPKSNAATRRRLRELCKRKATISPHYQRLLQSRSPTPFTSASRSTSRSVGVSSPVEEPMLISPFSTRDIQMSLTTSTASTMQPDAPLAQLMQRASTPGYPQDEWFNDTSIPWASPAPIPSEIDHPVENVNGGSSLPRLGSPFGYHTWGPSRSRQQEPPATPRAQSGVHTNGLHLRSPIQLHGTYPYPSSQKRRAQHELDEELSPGGTDLQKRMMEELFGSSSVSASRRVRSRGFTTGDVTMHDRLTALYSTPSDNRLDNPFGTPSQPAVASNAVDEASIKRLASPFDGISSRPYRIRGRHMPSISLDPNTFSSIDQRLGQAGFKNASQ